MKKSIFATILFASTLFAQSDSFYEYVKVKSSEPVYEEIYREIPNRECKEVTYKVRVDDGYHQNQRRDDSLGIDSLIGTAAGAVIGSQIGKGNGRVAAQIVGGLLGAKVAHEIRNQNSYDDYDNGYESYRHETRTECYNKPKRVKEKVLTGYKNYFIYKGMKHYKISETPLKRVKITHMIKF